jgi:hypothetical protein
MRETDQQEQDDELEVLDQQGNHDGRSSLRRLTASMSAMCAVPHRKSIGK